MIVVTNQKQIYKIYSFAKNKDFYLAVIILSGILLFFKFMLVFLFGLYFKKYKDDTLGKNILHESDNEYKYVPLE